jgi:AcrR family transcriptional regulator
MPDVAGKPVGRDAVMEALVDAAGQLILERGVTMSVRDIARRAGVNHGLVHTYFGSKEALLAAAFGHLVDRAAVELDDDGFPPADLAFRRGGEVARALARTMLDVTGDPYPSHPILPSWRSALATRRPDATDAELDEAVIVATTLGLGWALFAEHLCSVLRVADDERDAIEQRVLALISDIGGIPSTDAPAPSDDRASD